MGNFFTLTFLFFYSVLAAPVCIDNVTLQISATAMNLAIPANLDISTLINLDAQSFTKLSTSLQRQSINGTYTISSRYCEPETYNSSRSSTIQLLVHGVGYSEDYWSGTSLLGGSQSNSTNRSWVDYASKQGYPTLSIDRICNGNSTHLDGSNCQLPLNVAIIHEIIQEIRGGTIAGRTFEKVIWVGHSLGSLIGNLHAQTYPRDIDGYVLTAFSSHLIDNLAGILAAYRPLPSFLVLPQKYGTLGPTYYSSASHDGFEEIFYFDDYVEAIVNADFGNRGTLAIGELITALLGQLPATEYVGPVLVLTGQNDAVFCGRLEVGTVIGIPGDCGSGDTSYAAQSRSLFPNSLSFRWALVPGTGHILNFHQTAPDTFRNAHDFMIGQGF